MNLQKAWGYKKLIVAGAFLVAFVCFLFFTNPQDLPLFLLFVPFILLFLALYHGSSVFIKHFVSSVSGSRRIIIAVSLAALPTLLLLLKSINQSSVPDLILVVALLTLITFYFSRIDFLK